MTAMLDNWRHPQTLKERRPVPAPQPAAEPLVQLETVLNEEQ